MSDYYEEHDCTADGAEGPYDFEKHYERLQVLAIMNNIDMEIEVPEASQRAVASLPVHEMGEGDPAFDCAVCKEAAEVGRRYKVLPCKHEFHEECIMLWLRKTNSCPLCRCELETDDPDYEQLPRNPQEEADKIARKEFLKASMYL